MPLPPDAAEHPDALTEGLDIARSGSVPHLRALGELSRVLDWLFDGPGNPPYLGASRRIEAVFYECPPYGEVRVFLRWFWGDGGAGVVAVVCLKGSRPVLMSVVAIDLPGAAGRIEEGEAESLALNSAHSRSSDI